MRAIITLIAFLFFLYFANPALAADLLINEFLPNSSSEWVELYNSSDTSIDLSDYYFDDDTNFDSDSGSSAKIALSGILPTLQSCYWELSSYLNNNGDSPTLFKVQSGTSTSADTYTYASSSAGFSYARVPDGGSWAILQNPTQASNKCIDLAPTPTPTNTPTPTPTSTPTPAPTATPTPSPTPTKTPTPTSIPNTPTPISKPMASPTTANVLPTFVLGESTENELILSPTENPLAKSKNASNDLQKILMLIGVVFISACAILAFRAIKKEKLIQNEDE